MKPFLFDSCQNTSYCTASFYSVDIDGKEGKFFQKLNRKINCDIHMLYPFDSYSALRWPPPRQPPSCFLEEFEAPFNDCQLAYDYLERDKPMFKVWSDNDWFHALNIVAKGQVGDEVSHTESFLKMIKKNDFKGKKVLVHTSSTDPWLQAVVIAAGAHTVTTLTNHDIEFNNNTNVKFMNSNQFLEYYEKRRLLF